MLLSSKSSVQKLLKSFLLRLATDSLLSRFHGQLRCTFVNFFISVIIVKEEKKIERNKTNSAIKCEKDEGKLWSSPERERTTRLGIMRM